MLSLVAVADIPTNFLKDHPEAAAWAISFLAALLLIVLGVTIGLAKWAGGKFERIASTLMKLAGFGVDVQKLTDRVQIVERDQIATVKMAEAMTSLHDAFSEMKLENVEAHAAIIQGRISIVQEVSGLKARLDAVDAKVEDVKKRMPNGDLKDMIAQQKETNTALFALVEAFKPGVAKKR